MNLIKDIKDFWGVTPTKIWIILSCFASWVFIANIQMGRSSYETLTYAVDYWGSPGWGYEILNHIFSFMQLHVDIFHEVLFGLGILVWLLGSRRSSQRGFASFFVLEMLASYVRPFTGPEVTILVTLWVLSMVIAFVCNYVGNYFSALSAATANVAVMPLLVIVLPAIFSITIFTGDL